jgi:hypothetical protein
MSALALAPNHKGPLPHRKLGSALSHFHHCDRNTISGSGIVNRERESRHEVDETVLVQPEMEKRRSPLV